MNFLGVGILDEYCIEFSLISIKEREIKNYEKCPTSITHNRVRGLLL